MRKCVSLATAALLLAGVPRALASPQNTQELPDSRKTMVEIVGQIETITLPSIEHTKGFTLRDGSGTIYIAELAIYPYPSITVGEAVRVSGWIAYSPLGRKYIEAFTIWILN